MPLRDHFRPPVSLRSSWEGFHGGWPMVIVQQLRDQLPPGYVAEPRVRLGTMVEVNLAALETVGERSFKAASNGGPGKTAALAWSGERPVVAVETKPPEEYEHEVRVFDLERAPAGGGDRAGESGGQGSGKFARGVRGEVRWAPAAGGFDQPG